MSKAGKKQMHERQDTGKVIYEVKKWGYTVAVVAEGKIAYLYSATNNPPDSQGPIVADGVPLQTLQRWARETARELAEAWQAEFVVFREKVSVRGSER